jgi:uncharacterized protein YutD
MVSKIIDTEHGQFELVKEYKEAFDTLTFNERYIPEIFDKYPYIVGDLSSEILRLKGFSKDNKTMITDYLMESGTPGGPYFVIKRI